MENRLAGRSLSELLFSLISLGERQCPVFTMIQLTNWRQFFCASALLRTDHELRGNIVKVALDSRGDRPTLEPRLVASLLRPHNHTISNKKTPLMQPPL